MTCPICGADMTRTALSGRTAPWLCVGCKHAWWNAELTDAARIRFRRRMRDFGHDRTVADAVAVERERAMVRAKGTP